MTLYIVLAIAVFVLGLWIGLGAPGWPYKPEGGRQHLQKRAINPVAWGRTPKRDRLTPRTPGDRKLRLR